MEPLASIAALGGGLFVIFVLVLVILAVFGRPGSAQPLLLEQALRRQGDDAAHRALASGGHDFAAAVHRCLACNQAAQCRSWLSSGARDGYHHFCPNAGYIERMKT